MTKQQPYGTVLIKAAKIMDYLSLTKVPPTLKDISETSEMTMSTTLKILETLILIGFVTKNDQNKTYTIGPAMARYGNKYMEESKLKDISGPILENLQTKVDETIHLGVANGHELIYIDKLEPKHQSIFMSSKIGMSRPLYSTGMGKIFLSSFTEEQLSNYLAETPLYAYTEQTIVEPKKLVEEINHIRKTATAFDDEEMEKDCFCVAMPIQKGEVLEGSFSVSMPKFRANEDRVQEIISAMLQAKNQMEEALMT